MDGKLLILCDELPGDYEHHKVKDIYFLKQVMIDPDDNPDRLFVTWDAIIPKDKSFIEKCMHYASMSESIPADFSLRQRGTIDSKNGNIKGSIQEESFLKSLDSNIAYLKSEALNGEDAKIYISQIAKELSLPEDDPQVRKSAIQTSLRALAMDLAVQYPFQANEQFFEDFSAMLNANGIVRILLAHKTDQDENLIRERMALMDAWQNQNKFYREKASSAEILEPMMYDEFGEVYSRSSDEIMKVYSLPIF